MRLSHFDPVGPLQSIPPTTICSPYALALSHDGVTQSASLLKNLDARLPLAAAEVGEVAVIGPTALLSRSDAGYYGPSNVCGGNFFTLVDALANGGSVKTVTTPGVSSHLHSKIPLAPPTPSRALATISCLTLT